MTTRAPRPGLHVKWLESRNGERDNVMSISYFGSTTSEDAFSRVVNKACEIGRESGRLYIWANEMVSNDSEHDVQTQAGQTTYVPVPQPGMPAVAVTTPARYQRRRTSSALFIGTFVSEETVRRLNIPTWSQVYIDARTCTIIPKE